MPFTVIIGVASAIVTILSWAIPDSRAWLLAHPGIGWTAALLLAFAVVWLLATNDRLHTEVGRTADERAAHRAEETNHNKTRSKLTDALSQRDTAIAERDKANAALYPTPRDKQQFQDIMTVWDQRGDIMTWLNVRFNAKQWSDEDCKDIYDFVDVWQFIFFDNPDVDSAFKEFFHPVQSLVTWMSLNAGWDHELNKGRSNSDPIIYSVADGDERAGGWPAFDALRDEALAHVHAIFELRDVFEREGRLNGL